jgi:DNA-binding response OmpR family regulator
MTPTEIQTHSRKSRAAWRVIPPLMRVLFVANRQRTGGWLAEAFSAESISDLRLEEVLGSSAGMARLRDDTFDAVLVSHDPPELNALELIEGYRAGGTNEPIIVMGLQSEQEMAAAAFEVGADGYVCASTTTSRNLIWVIARAVQHHQLMRENHRLALDQEQRLQREHDEAERLLRQQRTLIGDLETIQSRLPADVDGGRTDDSARGACSRERLQLPQELIVHYRELLRAYVIMGSGNLACELSRLADLLVTTGISARQTMQLHVLVLEELVGGLGSRSTRHVMTRADLLALEIMVHLADNYRDRYRERIHTPTQRLLPGFEEFCSDGF